MLDPLLNSTSLPLLKQVARFGERRQEVLAGNIANIDTPGYRMRDLPVAEFQQALQHAISRQQRPAAPGTASPGHASPGLLSLDSPTAPLQLTEELFPESLFTAQTPLTQDHITFQDANNRSVENQFLQMTKNTLMQQFALEVMRSQFDQLQIAISERV